MPEGLCVQFYKVFEDKCNCEHYEKPFCRGGGQIGIDCENNCAFLPLPGCYVAYICTTDDYEGDDGCWRVNAEICDHVESLTAVYTAANGVA